MKSFSWFTVILLKLLAKMDHAVFYQILPNLDKWSGFPALVMHTLKIQEQRQKTLQWYSYTPVQLKRTFLRNGKIKHQALLSYSDSERETQEMDMWYCSRCLAKSSFCSFIWHSRIECAPCSAVSLTGKGSNTELLKSVSVLISASLRAGSS